MEDLSPDRLRIDIVPVYSRLLKRFPISEASKIIREQQLFERQVYDSLKRLMDIVGALTVIILTSWLYPFIYMAVYLDDGRPVFRKEQRIGKDSQVFSYYKFRSMSKDTEVKWLEKNDRSVTRVGRVLRRTRLDELPQLLSVVMGQLSLVGPRPDLIDFYPRLKAAIPFYDLRYRVKPGMTGWAQVNQPIQPHTVEQTKERLEYDFYYLKYRSLWLDSKILLKTFLILSGFVSKDPTTL